MTYSLFHWQCFEIDHEYFGRTRVLVGVRGKGLFQVTEDLAEFDPATRAACTSFGNLYVLEDESGLTAEALKKWQALCETNKLTGVVDVTTEYTRPRGQE